MNITKLFPFLYFVVSLTSLNQWFRIDIVKDSYLLLLNVTLILSLVWYLTIHKKKLFNRESIVIILFSVWMGLGIVRGIFVAENYWEWKHLTFSSQALFLPLIGLAYTNSRLAQNSISIWLKYSLPLFIVYAILLIRPSSFGYYLSPIILLGILFPFLSIKWRVLTIVLMVIVLLTFVEARSSAIKSAVILLIILFYFLRILHNTWVLNALNLFLYITPILLLVLGVTGIFNIFNMSDYIGENSENRGVLADTRSFIYEEQIASAINNNYVLFGRSPARGFDSVFGEVITQMLEDTGNTRGGHLKNERFSCEVLFLNIFNYLGLTGVILYSLIYFQASYLALKKSNNLIVKMIGLYIAFRWAYGWVEDFNRLDIMNLTLWLLIGMAFSNEFRKMSNKQIGNWVNGLFESRSESSIIKFKFDEEIKGDRGHNSVL